MSDIASRIDPARNARLLISQWLRAPRLSALAQGVLEVVDRHLVRPLSELEAKGRIETADGVWLDYIGERLGITRPAVMGTEFSAGYFGFAGSEGVGFDQGIFATVNPALSPRVPAGDTLYRKLLRLRALELLADGSVSALEVAVREVFPALSYQDLAGMEVAVHGAPVDLAILVVVRETGAWPLPAGVSGIREYIRGGDCEGAEAPVLYGNQGHNPRNATFEQSDEQAHGGSHSWKLTVRKPRQSTAAARAFVAYNAVAADYPAEQMLTYSAWVYVPASGQLALTDVYLRVLCRHVGANNKITWTNTPSGNPSAYDTWERLEVEVDMGTDCETFRLGLWVNNRSATHVVYWDDISVRGKL